jgi:hypothetical protein
MATIKDVEFKLSRVKEISFSCTDLVNDLTFEEIEKHLKIEIGFNFQVIKEENEFALSTLILYLFKTEEVLKYENQTFFKVKNIDQVVTTENDKINIKDEFLLSLLSIVIGTTRGMMIKNTMGKKINEFPLPVLNPKELLDTLKAKTIEKI